MHIDVYSQILKCVDILHFQEMRIVVSFNAVSGSLNHLSFWLNPHSDRPISLAATVGL